MTRGVGKQRWCRREKKWWSARGCRCRLAETALQRKVRRDRLFPGHLLLKDRGYERVENCLAATETKAGIGPVKSFEPIVTRIETLGVIVVAEQHRAPIEEPAGTGPPRPDAYQPTALFDQLAAGSVRGARCLPNPGVVDAHVPVSSATAQR